MRYLEYLSRVKGILFKYLSIMQENDRRNLLSLLSVILLSVLISVDARAQHDVSGSVLDARGETLPSATVLLLHSADSALVKGGITDQNGIFLFKDIPPGTYFLSISMVGFSTHFSSPFKLTCDHVSPAVRLEESIEQLGEVSVTARRQLYEKKVDRLVVNVQRSITSSGSSALEVLEKSPGIQINRQSNDLSLNGKSGVKVMMNGKIMRLPLESILTMLDGMSAANIDQIELITNPPAKYEAEGDAGMINIKTKEFSDLGYTGSVGANAGYNNAETLGGNVAFSRRGKRLAFYINYSINYDNNNLTWYNERSLDQDGFNYLVRSDNERDPVTGVQNLSIGAEYDLSDKTNVDLLLTGLRRKWETNDLSENLVRPTPGSRLLTEMHIHEVNLWRNGIINTGFEHAFEEDHLLSVDLDYLYYINDNPSTYQNRFLEGDPSLMGSEFTEVEKETPINIWVSKIDYSNKISEALTIETGLKGTLSDFYNDVRVYDRVNGNLMINNTFSNEADLNEFIGAAYFSANLSPTESIRINGGVRFEYVTRELTSPGQGRLVDSKDRRLFPSLFLQKSFNDDNKLNLSYSRRTTRPGFWDLAPFVFFVNPKTVISGNSNLESSISDGISLGYTRGQLILSLGYTHSRDEIVRWQPTTDTDTNEQSFNTQNLDYLDTYSLTLSFPVDPAPWWNIQINASGRYQFYRTSHLENNFRDEGSGMNTNVVNTIDLKGDFSFELSGFYQSASIWGVSRTRPSGSLNAGIQKKIMDGQGTIRLSAIDLLHTNIWKSDYESENGLVDTFFRYDYGMQGVRLSFSWNFGSNDFEEVRVEAGSKEEQDRVGINN